MIYGFSFLFLIALVATGIRLIIKRKEYGSRWQYMIPRIEYGEAVSVLLGVLLILLAAPVGYWLISFFAWLEAR